MTLNTVANIGIDTNDFRTGELASGKGHRPNVEGSTSATIADLGLDPRDVADNIGLIPTNLRL